MIRLVLALLAITLSTSSTAFAQCTPHWRAATITAPNGTILALCVYRGELIAAGAFTTIDGVTANRIARWDGATWRPLGPGLSGTVNALTVYNDELFAGGEFSFTGPNGTPANLIARWDGAQWQSVGGGLANGILYSLSVFNGELIAGGTFRSAGTVHASKVARWNGSEWRPLGVGMGDADKVATLAVYHNELIAGGLVSFAGGSSVSRIARWDGTQWRSLAQGLSSSPEALTVYDDKLIAIGLFTSGAPAFFNHIASWNGTAWSAMGTGFSTGSLINHSLCIYQGELIAGHPYSFPSAHCSRWNGSTWQSLPGGMTYNGGTTVYALAVYHDELIAAGNFPGPVGITSPKIARWVRPTQPSITIQPQSLAACSGMPASFTVNAAGTGPFTYQWHRGQQPIDAQDPNLLVMTSPDGRSSTLTIITTASSHAASGSDGYSVSITNACGTIDSSPASLSFNSADFDNDGDTGTDADIEAFFACLAGNCCPACGSSDFNADGDFGTDADIESFFRVLAGGNC